MFCSGNEVATKSTKNEVRKRGGTSTKGSQVYEIALKGRENGSFENFDYSMFLSC